MRTGLRFAVGTDRIAAHHAAGDGQPRRLDRRPAPPAARLRVADRALAIADPLLRRRPGLAPERQPRRSASGAGAGVGLQAGCQLLAVGLGAGELDVLVAAHLVGQGGDRRSRRRCWLAIRPSINVSSACSNSGIMARSSLRTSAQRNGSASVPRTRFIARRAANDGLPVRRNLSLWSSPSERSIGGCRW